MWIEKALDGSSAQIIWLSSPDSSESTERLARKENIPWGENLWGENIHEKGRRARERVIVGRELGKEDAQEDAQIAQG